MDCDVPPLRGITSSNIFARIASIVSLGGVFANDTFLIYLTQASIGFNYPERELVITNPSYPYSYICSLENGEWSKMSYHCDFISNSYPHLLAARKEDGGTVLLAPNDNVSGENAILLISRPLLWGGKLYKRVLQMMLHAVVKPAAGTNGFNGLACYLLCSNDGVNFKLVTGSERRAEFSDMVFPYMPTQSYRYFAIVLAGNISTDSRINAVEMYIDAAWNNRLR